jgi:predicted aspartyl protease
MGFTYVSVIVRGQKTFRPLEMLADTGSTYIVLPSKAIEELGLLQTPYKVNLVLADRRSVEAKLFLAEVEAQGRKGPAFVAELDTPRPLLGVYALETLGFKVNPKTGELEEIAPEGGFLLTAAHSITVIICTLNEEENLPYILPKIPDWVDEIILVDGHSTDNTVEVARRLRPEIKVLYQPGRGKGDALRQGFQQASGDIIVTLDADGSTDPEELPKFIEPLINGYDFAKGSRFLNNRPNMPLHRRFGNWVLVTTANLLYGTKYTDICSGYNAFWKRAIEKVSLSSYGFEMEQEMNVKIKKAGLKVIEVPCQDRGRLRGTSKTQDLKQGLTDLITIIKKRFRG